MKTKFNICKWISVSQIKKSLKLYFESHYFIDLSKHLKNMKEKSYAYFPLFDDGEWGMVCCKNRKICLIKHSIL